MGDVGGVATSGREVDEGRWVGNKGVVSPKLLCENWATGAGFIQVWLAYGITALNTLVKPPIG